MIPTSLFHRPSHRSLPTAVMAAAALLFGLVGAAFAQSGSGPAPATVEVEVGAGLDAEPFDVPRQLVVPEGYGIEVWARVEGVRFLAVAPNGDVLASQPNFVFGESLNEGAVTLLRPRDGEAPETFDFLSGLLIPHDMVFHTLDGTTYLYVAAGDEIVRYVYEDGMTEVGEGETIVTGLPTEPLEGQDVYRHPLKNIALDGPTLYVSIASSTNADPADLEAEPKRGAIYSYDASTPDQQATDGTLYANGVRNAEGLAFAPGDGGLWAVVNNRDVTRYPFHDDWENDGSGDDYGKIIQSFVDNYPADEIIRLEEGAHYGWPFCNPNPSDGFDDMPFDRDVETNPEGTALDCETEATTITKGIQPHAAPLGASFWTTASGAYENAFTVALHGSWNRSSFSGNKVVLYPYADGSLGAVVDLVGGWVIDPVAQTRWGRPVDTAPLADGSLLISDDYSGTIYRLYPKGGN